MFVKELTVLALAIFAMCSANPTSRVVGGENAEAGQFPYQVALRRLSSHTCGGSIISNKFILTAAHCVVESGINPFPASQFSVLAGTINRLIGGVIHSVSKVTVHEGYANFLNDLAILELSTALVFNANIQKIDLATTEVPAGSEVTISGWGLSEDQGPTLPYILQWTTLKSISRATCAATIGMTSNSLLCLSHPKDNGACNGDSGGPAKFNGELVGVAGFVVDGCGSTYPDGYGKVSYHIKWILEHSV